MMLSGKIGTFGISLKGGIFVKLRNLGREKSGTVSKRTVLELFGPRKMGIQSSKSQISH